MTDRSLPAGDGAAACPFIAFDADRDDRSDRADPSHRCYAESPPSPLSRAHQEAYCLVPAFPTCPVFQAWARREAAHVKPSQPPTDDAGRQREADSWPGMVSSRELVRSSPDAGTLTAFQQALNRRPSTANDPLPAPGSSGSRDAGAPGQDDDDDDLSGLVGGGRSPFARPLDGGASGTDDPSQRRNPQQPWSAPPPWVQGAGSPADSPADSPAAPSAGGWTDSQGRPNRWVAPEADDARNEAAPGPIARRAQGAGAADAAGLGVGPGAAGYAGPGSAGYAGASSASAGVGAGLAGSAAGPAGSSGRPGVQRLSGPPGEMEPVEPAPPRRGSGLASILGWDRRPRAGSPRPPDASRVDAGRPDGSRAYTPVSAEPAWERPRRYEAYPTLRTRVGLPMPSRVAIGAVAIVVAALALFFVPPLLLPKNGGTVPVGPSVSVAPSAVGSGSVHASLPPATIAAPTPLTYKVTAGDTLSKIARKFGVTVAQILAANKNIKNANKIAIGDVIIIPVSTPSVITDGGPTRSP